MRAIFIMLLSSSSALADAWRPVVPRAELDTLCFQMNYAARWLAEHPDDIDAFLERYLENGTPIERILADVAVRESVGASNFNTGAPASVQTECTSLRRQMKV